MKIQCEHHGNCGSIKECCGTFPLDDCCREATTADLIKELEARKDAIQVIYYGRDGGLHELEGEERDLSNASNYSLYAVPESDFTLNNFTPKTEEHK